MGILPFLLEIFNLCFRKFSLDPKLGANSHLKHQGPAYSHPLVQNQKHQDFLQFFPCAQTLESPQRRVESPTEALSGQVFYCTFLHIP